MAERVPSCPKCDDKMGLSYMPDRAAGRSSVIPNWLPASQELAEQRQAESTVAAHYISLAELRVSGMYPHGSAPLW